MKILNEIKPTAKEKQKVKRVIESVLKKIKIDEARFELGGSYAKDTFLKGNHDVDVFVKFPYKKYKDKDISEILNKRLSRKHKRVHGSRDYFQLQKKGYTFEFIPVLNIKDSSQAKNITDVSLLHKKWVKKHLRKPDEVRLLKKFCRAQGVYGAESYIKGFSGYVLEILTIQYGTFYDSVKAISKWKLPIYVDASKLYRSKKDAFNKINKSKRVNELIIVDPTQKDRNAAAAISKERINILIKSCKNYLHNPSDDFFFEKKLMIKDLVV
jgi:tRNA nucleotidyltransferase (CCA-adding enzyme)